MTIKQMALMKKMEFAVAVALTLLAAWLHATRALHAGGLWRDEAGAAQVALMPSVREMAQVFQHEAFPLLFPLTVRSYAAVAGPSDMALRMFGLLVPLALIAVLWLNAHRVNGGFPLLSLALLAVNPLLIEWGDSLRGYGLGLVMILLTFGLIWSVATSRSRWVVGIALLAAVCSVQILFYNAVLLFALGLAGVAVAMRDRQWIRALLVLGICGAAALSLIPYLAAIQNVREWSVIFRLPDFSLALFCEKLSEALGSGPRWVWIILVVAGLAAGVISQFRFATPARENGRAAGLYCLVALLVSITAYFGFLKNLSYPTQPWYYLALVGFVAVAAEGALAALPRHFWKRACGLSVALAFAIWSFAPARAAAHLRRTNMDLIALKLSESASSGDVIVLMPWYLGVSFNRYYDGPAQWMTLPPIGEHRIHRYDLFKAQMAATDPIAPVLKAMADALKSGHRVWIVGRRPTLPEGEIPVLLPPAPYETFGWNAGFYASSWSQQVAYFLQRNVLTAEELPLPSEQAISPHEDAKLIVTSGWQGGPW